jgi:hypothetical protein
MPAYSQRIPSASSHAASRSEPCAPPAFSLRRRQKISARQASALRARDALVLEHLPLGVTSRLRGAIAIDSATSQRLFPLVPPQSRRLGPPHAAAFAPGLRKLASWEK